jgi:hypothetical protein
MSADGTSVAPSRVVRFTHTQTRPLSENARDAVRLLRHLYLAQLLWGRDVALPIAALDAGGRRVGTLRALLHLEREGAVVLHRLCRAVCLVVPVLDAASEGGATCD